MKAFKNLLIGITIFLLAFSIPFWAKPVVKGFYIFCFIALLFFLFNILTRGYNLYKPYFLSKWNIFTSKFRREVQYDIPKELMFDKLLEVIPDSPFQLKYANGKKLEILAVSKISWHSWGENIYIDLFESGNKTIIRFDAVTLFQMYDWGKNENNFDAFLNKLDESLTI